MRILFFASLAEITGKKEIESNSIHSINDLKEFLYSEYPSLKQVKYSIAVNQSIVQGNELLKEHDEIALLPPFSGG